MKNVSSVFDHYTEAYDGWFDSHDGKLLFDVEVETVKRLLLNIEIEKPFLEIGVGTGRFAQALGIEFGIDPSLKSIEIAAKRRIKVATAVGESLPFGNSSFGAVFLLFTICFVQAPERIFSELSRVLKKRGRLIVGMITGNSPWGMSYRGKKAEGHPIYRHAQFYTVSEVWSMLERTGYVVEAFSSALCQPPGWFVHKNDIHGGLAENAGFVCIIGNLS